MHIYFYCLQGKAKSQKTSNTAKRKLERLQFSTSSFVPVVVNLKHIFELFGLYTTCFLIQKLLELIRLSSDGQFWRKSQNKKGGKFELRSQLCCYNCICTKYLRNKVNKTKFSRSLRINEECKYIIIIYNITGVNLLLTIVISNSNQQILQIHALHFFKIHKSEPF